jgi:hypothetical protein
VIEEFGITIDDFLNRDLSILMPTMTPGMKLAHEQIVSLYKDKLEVQEKLLAAQDSEIKLLKEVLDMYRKDKKKGK